MRPYKLCSLLGIAVPFPYDASTGLGSFAKAVTAARDHQTNNAIFI